MNKAADLRVLVVGREVFAVRIESGMLDWRRDYSPCPTAWWTCPTAWRKRFWRTWTIFGLASGSFDFAVDEAGCLWWLELNPNGQWGWLEESTGLAMSAAFAELLTQGVAP